MNQQNETVALDSMCGIVKTSEVEKAGRLVLEEYPEFVLGNAKPNNRQAGFENVDDVTAKRMLAYTGLSGEAGEVSEFFKKYFLHGKEYDRDALLKEMGDVMWYFFLMCEMEGISFVEVLESNMKKLAERHFDNPDMEENKERFKKILGLS